MSEIFLLSSRTWKICLGCLAFLLVACAPLAAGETAPMTNEDIVKLVRAGLGAEVIIAAIRARECNFATDVDDLIQLKNSGVPSLVIDEMIRKGAHPSEAGAPSVADTTAESGGQNEVLRFYFMGCSARGWRKYDGTLVVDGKEVKFLDVDNQEEARCSTPWSEVAALCFEYAFRGVMVITRKTGPQYKVAIVPGSAEAMKPIEAAVRKYLPSVSYDNCD